MLCKQQPSMSKPYGQSPSQSFNGDFSAPAPPERKLWQQGLLLGADMSVKRNFCLSLLAFGFLCHYGHAFAQVPFPASSNNISQRQAFTELEEAKNWAYSWEAKNLYDPQTGVFSQKGKGFPPSIDSTGLLASFEKEMIAVRKSLSNAEAIQKFDAFIDNEKRSVRARLEEHEQTIRTRQSITASLASATEAPLAASKTITVEAKDTTTQTVDALAPFVATLKNNSPPITTNETQTHADKIDAALDAYDTAAKRQTPTIKENQTDTPFTLGFLALSVAVSFIITWGLGLAPAFIARYAVYKGPLTKRAANWIAGISSLVFFFGFRVLNAALEERGNGAVWILIFFVSRWIMTRGDKNAPILKPKASVTCKATSFLWKSPTVRVFVAAQIVWLVLLLFSNSLTFQYVFDFYYYDEARFAALAILPPTFILISLILGRWAWASFKKTDPTAQ